MKFVSAILKAISLFIPQILSELKFRLAGQVADFPMSIENIDFGKK